MAKKILFHKKVGNNVESIYPKTSSDITIYDESTGESIKSKIDSIVSKEDNLIRIGTCATAAGEKNKIVTCANFVLYTGAIIAVKFTYTNSFSATAANPITLNVNNTGAKNIYYNNTGAPTGTNTIAFGIASYYHYYIYDGTYWVYLSRSTDADTTYTNQSLGNGYGTCTTAEATAAKAVALSGYTLTTHGFVTVKFTNAVPANATLNINSKGAKAIHYNGAAITAGIIAAGDIATFVYNGNYILIAISRAIDSALSSTSINPVQNNVVNTALNNKVDKVSGKELSTNDFTNDYKSALDNLSTNLAGKVDVVEGSSLMTSDEHTKLAGIEAGANKITVDSALSSTSTNPLQNKVINTALGNKINTSAITTGTPASTNTDAQVPSTLSMYTALDTKVDKVSGKGLSTNDFTTSYKNKIDNIIVYCTCTTAAATQVKQITVPEGFTLFTGVIIAVKFTYSNTYKSTASAPVKFNVGNTGEKQVYYAASAANTGTNTTVYGQANYVHFYMYDGTYWVWISRDVDNDTNTTYSNASLGCGYATCTTDEATVAKAAAFVNGTYTLVANGIVAVKFTNAVPASATLNINSKGAKAIYFNGAAITAGVIKAGDTVTLFYDNTKYNIINIMHDRPNIIYWGGSEDAIVDAAFITGLGNSEAIEDRKKDSFSVNLTAGQYLYIAIPTNITNPIISLFGFVTNCVTAATNVAVEGTNYNVYRAPHEVNVASTYIAKIE